MNNNVIQTAIANVNENRNLAAVQKAQCIIAAIETEQKSRVLYVKQLAEGQAALAKISDTTVSYESVMGVSKPTSPTTTQQAIIDGVEGIVKGRVESVRNQANALANSNANTQVTIEQIDKRIADHRKNLSELTVETVTAETVLG